MSLQPRRAIARPVDRAAGDVGGVVAVSRAAKDTNGIHRVIELQQGRAGTDATIDSCSETEMRSAFVSETGDCRSPRPQADLLSSASTRLCRAYRPDAVTTYGAIAQRPRHAACGARGGLGPQRGPRGRMDYRATGWWIANGCLSGGWHWGHPDVMAGLTARRRRAVSRAVPRRSEAMSLDPRG